MANADDELTEHSPDGDAPEPTGNFAQDGEVVLDYYVKRFGEVRGKSDVTRTDFWVCLVFDSVEQKNEFLALTKLGDKNDQYLNGVEVAKKLGVVLTSFELPKSKREDSYDALAMEI